MTRVLLSYIPALVVSGLLLGSCASTRTAPRFTQPSTKPIAEANNRAIGHVKTAKAQVKVLAREIEQKDPPLQLMKLQIASLEVDLDDALNHLSLLQGARKQLDEQLGQQTTRANNLADSYDKAGVQINSLKVSRHRWVTYALYAAGLALLEGVWIFRRPLMFLIGGIGGV